MKVFLAFLVLVAAAVGLAAAFVPDQAASVGGVGISQSTLNGDLSTIAGNTDYACALEAEGLDSLPGASIANDTTNKGGVYAVSAADFWLGELIQDQVASDLVAKDGLTVTTNARSFGRIVLKELLTDSLSTAECSGSAATLLASLPHSLVDQQTTKWADQLLLAAHVEGTSLSTTGLESYYAAHQADYDKVCFAYLEFRTKTAATAASTAVSSGSSTFAAEQTAVAATTAKAATQAAGTHCTQRQGPSTTVLGSAVGTLVGPISEDTGGVFLLIQITSATPTAFSAVRSTLPLQLLSAAEKTVDKRIAAEWPVVGVSIAPRYGGVSSTGAGIVAPFSPPATAVLTAKANLVASAVASTGTSAG